MYGLRNTLQIVWLGDGVGPQTVPESQSLKIFTGAPPNNSSIVPVPGGNSPSQANFNTAIDTLAVAMKAGVATNLGTVQGWATGGN